MSWRFEETHGDNGSKRLRNPKRGGFEKQGGKARLMEEREEKHRKGKAAPGGITAQFSSWKRKALVLAHLSDAHVWHKALQAGSGCKKRVKDFSDTQIITVYNGFYGITARNLGGKGA